MLKFFLIALKFLLKEERAQWGNPIEFILTVIGYAVGNLIRLDYLNLTY